MFLKDNEHVFHVEYTVRKGPNPGTYSFYALGRSMEDVMAELFAAGIREQDIVSRATICKVHVITQNRVDAITKANYDRYTDKLDKEKEVL